MSSPQRTRTIAAVVFLVGAGACLAGVLLGHGKDAISGVFGIGGATVAFFGGISAIVAHVQARSSERLRRGEGVVARWTVDPETWDAFVEANERFNKERGADLVNTLSARRGEPQGVEVIVGRDAVRVGEEYFSLPRGTYPVRGVEHLAGPPECVELELLWPGSGDQSDVRSSLRFPGAKGAAGMEATRRVVAEYRAALGAIDHRPLIGIGRSRQFSKVLLGVAVVCAGFFAAGLLLRGRKDLGQFPVMAALLGSLVGLGALVLSLVMYIRSRVFKQ